MLRDIVCNYSKWYVKVMSSNTFYGYDMTYLLGLFYEIYVTIMIIENLSINNFFK